MTHVLQAGDMTYAYEGGHPVFEGVTTAVASGEILGIVGPNGSGKSTLLRTLCGLLKPQAGAISLDEISLARFSRIERARILAFLPQTVTPAFALSVREVVCLGRYPHVGAFGVLSARDIEIAERCMRDTETLGFQHRDFMTLSGGERQRVLLASILAQEPGILLLDEPTSALDIHHQIEVFALLKRLAETGYGIGVVTHDLNLAARFCDRLLLLAIGESVIAHGAPADVLTEALLSRAYDAPIRVCPHPVTGTPLVTAQDPGAHAGEEARP